MTVEPFVTDPMEGACDWPPELLEEGAAIQVPADAPLKAWRFWNVQDGCLVAPFLPTAWQVRPDIEGVRWLRGVNKVSSEWCRWSVERTFRARGSEPPPPQEGPHPQATDCHCGIRAVQSLAATGLFGATAGAIAEVSVWGRVASYSVEGVDWPHTLRAEYAKLSGPIFLNAEHAHQCAALERRYRVKVHAAH